MHAAKLNKKEISQIEESVKAYSAQQERFEYFAKGVVDQLRIYPPLTPLIQFIKYRVKDHDHLRHKLARKALERKRLLKEGCENVPDPITRENLFRRVTDLAGVRLIHLHTQQLKAIHQAIVEVFDEQKYELIEAPTAKCWDSEYQRIYSDLSLDTEITEGYSSVHYVVRANTRSELTCELQVRTLTDEVWGEVSHRVNYPDESPSAICRDQLRTLARFTTGCTRLIDSIFASDSEARQRDRD